MIRAMPKAGISGLEEAHGSAQGRIVMAEKHLALEPPLRVVLQLKLPKLDNSRSRSKLRNSQRSLPKVETSASKKITDL